MAGFTHEQRQRGLEKARYLLAERMEARKKMTQHIQHGYTIQPATGITEIGEYVGWELHPPKDCGPPWFFMTKEECIAAVDRHLATYK